ncbi:slr1658 superfamily regulator [Inquilinus sp. OTU3971]|uniref:slr1658 superfamily regulator n=1 Tax=Inquilinus sp. OTU3971 TaxID=3043855 RepID=UPI00313BDEDC
MSGTVIGSPDIAIEVGASICSLQLFDGPLELNWHHCAITSDFISDLCMLRIRWSFQESRDVRHSVAYLTNELLENAVKFKASGNIGVQAAVTSRCFTVKTWNRIAAGSALRLQNLLSELMAGDAADLLIRKIESNAHSGTVESGLGLLTLMSDYGVRLAWTFEAVDRSDEVRLETCAALQIGTEDMTNTRSRP